MPDTDTLIPPNGASTRWLPPPPSPLPQTDLLPSRAKKRYENEHACGKAISDWLQDHPDVTREEIFYTTKLKTNVSRLDTVDKIKKSLKTSTLSYIDLYLLHSPIGGPDVRRECWAGCRDAKEYGWVKSIGVSNYGTKHIDEFVRAKAEAGGEMPVLNQLDNHPFMRRPEIVQACEREGILIEVRRARAERSASKRLTHPFPPHQAWGPLVRGQRFTHPVITSLAAKHGKTPAQVLLRWSIQHVSPPPSPPCAPRSLPRLSADTGRPARAVCSLRASSRSRNPSRANGSRRMRRSLTLSSTPGICSRCVFPGGRRRPPSVVVVFCVWRRADRRGVASCRWMRWMSTS